MLDDKIFNKYKITVGIECHVQLATNTKLFSGADNDERDKSPNSVVSPIDYGLPGMLPILNRAAIDLAIRAAKALNSEVARVSRFDRKHYFYPDLPKGYQITQMYQPIIGAGVVHVPVEDGREINVRIHHAHLEEDAGKLTHHGNCSLVDLNRAGTPLIEIVSQPDIHSAVEAKAYATELYHLMTYAGVTRGDLYHGNMRFDVNVSVALADSSDLGTRAEVKNLNSFRSVERAVEYEAQRQIALIEKGDKVVQETRGWDEAKQRTTVQRSKEDSQDYRYMPDADIPPIILSEEEIKAVQDQMPKLSNEWRVMLAGLGLDYSQIETLLDTSFIYSDTVNMLSMIEQSIDNPDKAKFIANWNVNMLVPLLSDGKFALSNFDISSLESSIYDLVSSNKISSTNAKALFGKLLVANSLPDVEQYAADQGYLQVSDEEAITQIVDAVLSDPVAAKAVADFKNGNEKVIGFLIGQVMAKSGGKANPSLAQKLIRQRI